MLMLRYDTPRVAARWRAMLRYAICSKRALLLQGACR